MKRKLKLSFGSLGLIALGFFLAQCSETSGLFQGEVNAGVEEGVIKAAAVSNLAGTVAADAGFAADGTTIAVPTGFDVDDCRFTASVTSISGASTVLATTVCIDPETGEVSCQKVVQAREQVPATTESCTASYTMICIKSI